MAAGIGCRVQYASLHCCQIPGVVLTGSLGLEYLKGLAESNTGIEKLPFLRIMSRNPPSNLKLTTAYPSVLINAEYTCIHALQLNQPSCSEVSSPVVTTWRIQEAILEVMFTANLG